MRTCRAALVGAALGIAAAVAAPAQAQAPAPPAPARPPPPAAREEAAVDDELLEFLGSVGGNEDDGGDWLDFLASTDIDKVAKGGAKAPVRGK